MKELIVECPLNSLSFGNVAFNFLRELHAHNRGLQVGVFPIGENVDISAYDQIDDDFKSWLQQAIDNRYDFLRKDVKNLRLWHLNGSDIRRTPNQTLYTFYELDQPTDIEKRVAEYQDNIIFSSSHAKEAFGVSNGSFIPIGFDKDFKVIEKSSVDQVHFGLMGKFEKRKHTKEIIQLWLKKYGNNPDYLLTCCVTNPFFPADRMKAIIGEAVGNQNYNNINFLPYLKTNSEVNEYLNAIDIDLSGLSGAEGWNLPAFNATALGKWSIVLNATSHKDWANSDNAILVEPNGLESAVDGVFFAQRGDFNQGNINTFDPEEVSAAMDEAVKRRGTVNEKGVTLQESFSYNKTVRAILETMI